MQVQEFINKCVDNGYDWSKGEHEGRQGYFIGSKRLDTVAHFTAESIQENEWTALNKQIIQGKDIYHVTRVVGYYSRVENWNKSKVGELKDRHKGDYALR